MDSTNPLIYILGLLITGGGGGGIWLYLRDRKQDPITREQAAIAAAETNVKVALQLRDTAVLGERTALGRIEALEINQEATKQKVNLLEVNFNVAVAHIKELWKWIASGAKPPYPEIPVELHELVQMPELNYVRQPMIEEKD